MYKHRTETCIDVIIQPLEWVMECKMSIPSISFNIRFQFQVISVRCPPNNETNFFDAIHWLYVLRSIYIVLRQDGTYFLVLPGPPTGLLSLRRTRGGRWLLCFRLFFIILLPGLSFILRFFILDFLRVIIRLQRAWKNLVAEIRTKMANL